MSRMDDTMRNRLEIERLTKEFIEKGGVIEEIGFGVSGRKNSGLVRSEAKIIKPCAAHSGSFFDK